MLHVEVDATPFDMLGNLYRAGKELPPYPDKAFEAFMTGAPAGNSNAMNKAARCPCDGFDADRDIDEAHHRVLTAAAAGIPFAPLRRQRARIDSNEIEDALCRLDRAVRAGSRDAHRDIAMPVEPDAATRAHAHRSMAGEPSTSAREPSPLERQRALLWIEKWRHRDVVGSPLP